MLIFRDVIDLRALFFCYQQGSAVWLAQHSADGVETIVANTAGDVETGDQRDRGNIPKTAKSDIGLISVKGAGGRHFTLESVKDKRLHS